MKLDDVGTVAKMHYHDEYIRRNIRKLGPFQQTKLISSVEIVCAFKRCAKCEFCVKGLASTAKANERFPNSLPAMCSWIDIYHVSFG